MKHPRYYTGIKQRVGYFLLRYGLLTTRQWCEVLLSDSDLPHTHEEFIQNTSVLEPERTMTRQQLEERITRPLTWQESLPTFRVFQAAYVLAVAGEIGGPESSLGPTREAALQLLRRRLPPVNMATIEATLAEYDRSGPHPEYIFGDGWTAEDQRRWQADGEQRDLDEGHYTYAEWLANRRAHWHLHLFDGLLSLKRLTFAVSFPRWYRELRYR